MRFTVCGEALIDLVAAPVGDDSEFRSTWQALSAGSPMNTAVALAQLDEDVQFLGRLSSDALGQQLVAHLERHRVGLRRASVVPAPTSLAVVSLDEQRKASYAFHFAGTANFGWRRCELPELDASDWLHVGSLLAVVPPGAAVVLEWLGDCPAQLSYDINVRESVIGDPEEYWAAVEPWLAVVGERSGLAKASDDDVCFLARAEAARPSGAATGGGGTGDRPDGEIDPLTVVRDWVERYRLGMFVLTLGPDGAAAVLPGGRVVRVPGYAVEVVDTVGAGDTFMAGFLAAWTRSPGDVEQALRHGAAASAIVCTRQGAQPPSWSEVQHHLAQGS